MCNCGYACTNNYITHHVCTIVHVDSIQIVMGEDNPNKALFTMVLGLCRRIRVQVTYYLLCRRLFKRELWI